MKIALLTGLGAGILCGFLHFTAMTGTTSAGGILYYAPLFIFFAAIYFSIKRNATVNHGGQIGFRDSLKYGGVTAILIAFIIGISFFVALTHTDVQGELNFMIEQKYTKEQIKETLAYMTRQTMFDRAKFFAMPYFLLGFMMTVGAAFVIKLMQAKRAQK